MQRFVVRPRGRLAPLGACSAGLLLAFACGGAAGAPSAQAAHGPSEASLPAAELALVAYSTPQETYQKLIAAFQQTAPGRNITFTQSYGASGDQSRAVESGLAADVVAFALEPDVTRLVKAGIVAPSWNADQYRGNVTDSVVVLATRQGNPKHVRGWDDLTRPGIEVITPNPFASGAARWNILAAYGAASQVGKDDQRGIAYLRDLLQHVSVQDTSARNSLQTFATGRGDVLISYESEAAFARQHGQRLEATVPDQTILVENPIAVTTRSKHPAQARAFVDFLRTTTAQRIFAAAGYRPVVSGVAAVGELGSPSHLFTIADLGGWSAADRRFFDPGTGVMVGIERRLGVTTR